MKKLIVASILLVALTSCTSLSKKDQLDAAYLLGCMDILELAEEVLDPEDVETLKRNWTLEHIRVGTETARAKIANAHYPR